MGWGTYLGGPPCYRLPVGWCFHHLSVVICMATVAIPSLPGELLEEELYPATEHGAQTWLEPQVPSVAEWVTLDSTGNKNEFYIDERTYNH